MGRIVDPGYGGRKGELVRQRGVDPFEVGAPVLHQRFRGNPASCGPKPAVAGRDTSLIGRKPADRSGGAVSITAGRNERASTRDAAGKPERRTYPVRYSSVRGAFWQNRIVVTMLGDSH